MQQLSLVMLCITVLTLSGCGTSIIRDDFNSDTVGMQPNPTPPPNPPNDHVDIFGPDEGNLVVVAAPDAINTRSLIYRFQPTVSQANFVGTVSSPPGPAYWAGWNGRARGFDGTTPTLRFAVGNLNFGHAILEIRNGNFVASGETLGAVVPDEVHTVILAIDTDAGTYIVSVFQRRGGILNSGSQPLSARGAYTGDSGFVLGVTHANTLSSHPATYVIDDIVVSEKESDMPSM